jgi:hypothetical protein
MSMFTLNMALAALAALRLAACSKTAERLNGVGAVTGA